MALSKAIFDKSPIKIAVRHTDDSTNTLVVFPWATDVARRKNFASARNQLMHYKIKEIKVAQFYDKETNQLIGEYRRDQAGQFQFYGNIF